MRGKERERLREGGKKKRKKGEGKGEKVAVTKVDEMTLIYKLKETKLFRRPLKLFYLLQKILEIYYIILRNLHNIVLLVLNYYFVIHFVFFICRKTSNLVKLNMVT